jgi:hypothetical protein
MMETALFLMAGGAVLAVGILENRRRARAWQDAAAACGLQVLETSPGWRPQILAQAGPVQVRIGFSGDKGRSTRIGVEAPWPPGFRGVVLRPQEISLLEREIEIGDKPFDQEFLIQGPGLLTAALLDEETRRLLSKANTLCRPEIVSGELKAVLPEERVRDVLQLLLDIARRLARPLDVPQGLADNARQDPVPGVRLHNLLLLIRELPEETKTAETLQAARSDPSPLVRLRVAPVAARALAATGSPAAEEPLIQALGREEEDVRMAAAEALGRIGTVAAVLPLKELAERFRGETRRAARQAIAEIQSRAEGASPGQLSLTAEEAGQLSLADDPAGRLSLPPEERPA